MVRAAGVLWLAGALVDGRRARRSGSPRSRSTTVHRSSATGAWRPRIGGATGTSRPRHFAERFQLFMIIALGESIVVTGCDDVGLDLDLATRGRVRGSRSSRPPLCGGCTSTTSRRLPSGGWSRPKLTNDLARDGYTYLHVVIVAGVIVSAVGDELVIAHPTDALHDSGALVALGGPALFLAGLMACAARIGQTQSVPRAVVVDRAPRRRAARRRRRRAGRVGSAHRAAGRARGRRAAARRVLSRTAGLS